MKTDDRVRLQHMLDAARKAVAFTQSRTRDDLETDEMLPLALVRLLEVIGEAGNAVSQDVRRQNPQVPWKEIASTRNRLIHGYFDVDHDIVWQIVTSDLPALISQLITLIGAPSP
jgi:uncharacterized protein with HEPN domain